MAINNQDKTEIHNLPEVTTLQPGMMVAVDSEPTGTKSFDLANALASKADTNEITELETEISGKADSADVTALETALAGKANSADLTALETTVNGKADSADVTALATTVAGKADASTTYTKSEVDQAIAGVREVPAATSSDEGKVLTVDSTGTPGWDTVNEVPASTSSDSNKFLMVNSSGTPEWNSLPPVGETLVVGVAVPLGSGDIVADKTYNEIRTAIAAGYNVVARVQQGSNPAFYDDWAEFYVLSRYSPDDSPDDNIAFTRVAAWDFHASKNDPRYNPSEQIVWASNLMVFNNNVWKTYSWNITPGLRDDGTKTADTTPFAISNNMHTSITTSLSALTINVLTGSSDIPNFVAEITPSSNLTLTVTSQHLWGGPVTTLKSSVAAGNTLTAGKTYQVTAVGTCWTMAEFEA